LNYRLGAKCEPRFIEASLLGVNNAIAAGARYLRASRIRVGTSTPIEREVLRGLLLREEAPIAQTKI